MQETANPFDVSEIVDKGLRYYDEHLKPLLEPDQNGRALALHVDTGEYVIADTLPQAREQMRRQRNKTDGRVLSLTIGPAPENDAFLQQFAGKAR